MTTIYLQGKNIYLQLPATLAAKTNLVADLKKIGCQHIEGDKKYYTLSFREWKLQLVLQTLNDWSIPYYDGISLLIITNYDDDYDLVRGDVFNGETGRLFFSLEPEYLENPSDRYGSPGYLLEKSNSRYLVNELRRQGYSFIDKSRDVPTPVQKVKPISSPVMSGELPLSTSIEKSSTKVLVDLVKFDSLIYQLNQMAMDIKTNSISNQLFDIAEAFENLKKT